MYTRTAPISGRPLLGAVAVACSLIGANAAAEDHEVTVAIHVSTQGLNLRHPADAQTLYVRLKNAAWVACTRANRVNLAPVDNLQDCLAAALGGAIRSARAPMLTQIYLQTHSLPEAARYGIDVPAQLASK